MRARQSTVLRSLASQLGLACLHTRTLAPPPATFHRPASRGRPAGPSFFYTTTRTHTHTTIIIPGRRGQSWSFLSDSVGQFECGIIVDLT